MPSVQILEQRTIAPEIFELRFLDPTGAAVASPGQFVHIRVSDSFDFLLRRPLSVCRVDRAGGSVTVVYRVQGEGTARLARRGAGDWLDVLGPLGTGFTLHAGDRRALLVGGGVGVPPLVELARRLAGQGTDVVSAVGFQTRAQAILLDDLASCGELRVATDDGSLGNKGLVTGLLTSEWAAGVDRYYACGPTPMLRAVQRAMTQLRVPGYLSLEERMGCGFGVCVGCVHPILRDNRVHNLKTCRDGPVFPAEEVVFP